MGMTQVTGAAAAASRQAAAETAQTPASSGDNRTLAEMMKDAKEKAEARRDQFRRAAPKERYGDAPIEAYARLARARNQAGVNAAAGFARRKIAQLQAAKRTDSENAQQIQAAIRQLRKAVLRAGKKNRELAKEQTAEKHRSKVEKEQRLREARRLRQELRRTQALRAIRESGYIREAEADGRMQSYMAKTQLELRNQAQALSAKVEPSLEAAAQQYAASSAMADPGAGGASGDASGGGDLSLQA